MDDLTLAHGRETAQMFRRVEPAAWRAPGAQRFDHLAANDGIEGEAESIEIPRWLVVVAGGAVAALMGALMGGMLSL